MAIRRGNWRSSSCARVITVDPPRLEGQSELLLLAGWLRVEAAVQGDGRAGPRVAVASCSARVITLAGLVSPSRELETREAAATAVPLFFCPVQKIGAI